MTAARRLHYSYEDYLRALEDSQIKLEYQGGEIYAMAGGTPTQGELAAAAIGLLRNALGGRCRVYTSDVKIRVERTDLSTFPDVSVVCGERQFSASDRYAITNPTLLVEITSPSTEEYDRGEKLRQYQQLPALQAVLIVSHRCASVTVVARTSNGWESHDHGSGERVALDCPPIEISVDELYMGIELEGAGSDRRDMQAPG